MSVRVMTAVWDLALPDSEKIVLLALADCANDEGLCWPSMATLAKKCTKSDRTVQGAIQELVAAGHLTRHERPGKGCHYVVHPRNVCAPEEAAPPKRTTFTPEAASDKPSRTIIPSKAKASSGRPRTGSENKKISPQTLSPEWTAPPVGDLSPMVRKLVEQWPAGAYEACCETFRLHWLNETRAIGRKSDWTAALGKWLIKDHGQVMRDAKAGVSFSRLAPAKPGSGASAQPVAERALEGGTTDGMRRELARILGKKVSDQWFEPAALLVKGTTIHVCARSKFAADHVEAQFRNQIIEAAGRAGIEATSVRAEVTSHA